MADQRIPLDFRFAPGSDDRLYSEIGNALIAFIDANRCASLTTAEAFVVAAVSMLDHLHTFAPTGATSERFADDLRALALLVANGDHRHRAEPS